MPITRLRSAPSSIYILIVVALIVVSLGTIALAQAPAIGSSRNDKIIDYIDHGWDTLSRSMTDCKSVVDPRLPTRPFSICPRPWRFRHL